VAVEEAIAPKGGIFVFHYDPSDYTALLIVLAARQWGQGHFRGL
jgi:hypothetical protein